MTEIYYCKNEKDIKLFVINAFKNNIKYNIADVDDLRFLGVIGCTECEQENCNECEAEECYVYNHIDDKNIIDKIFIEDIEKEYPCIVSIDEDYMGHQNKTITSMSEAKANTKYGIGNYY